MQRQSLGSPGSKLHTHGVASSKEDQKILLTLEDLPKRNNNGGNSSASNSPINDYDDDEEEKKIKATKPHKSPSKPDSEKFIHLIPILTLLCFLILYLCSHNPSQSDLAQFDGFKRPSSKSIVDADKVNDLSRFVEMNKGDVLAIRSLMNLEQMQNAPKFRSHRKLGDF